jgi:non-ribosomal peptide synthetase component F/SAM-dependent methyltransferase/acyl carrier protein
VPIGRDGELPLSYSQARLWMAQSKVGATPFYNVPCSYRLIGPLDLGALRRALDEIVERHEALRTTFPAVDGEPAQRIAPPAPVPLEIVDLGGEPDALEAATSWVKAEARRIFDIETGPVLRASLLRLGRDDHVLVMCMHHIVCDGTSMRVLGEELSALYGAFVQGAESPLPPLPVQYVDFAAWQARVLDEDALAPHLEYWRRQLADAAVLELPVDRPRALKRPYSGRQIRFSVPATTEAGLRAVCREHNATMFMVLLAAFHALLARASGQTDISVGTPVANRRVPAIEGLVGFFVNTLVMRADCSGNPTFTELVAQVRRTAVDAYAHQDLPFEVLVEELQPRTPPGFNPLFQVHFQLLRMPLRSIRMGDLDVEFFESSSGATPIDLFIHCFETDEGVEGWLEYAADLFEPETIDRLLGQFLTLLARWTEDPELRLWEVPLGAGSSPLPSEPAPPVTAGVDELVARRAVTDPDVWAITAGDAHLTYAELDARVARAARALAHRGVTPGEHVALLAGPSLDQVVGLFAIFRAGACAVVVDPADPRAWREAALLGAGVRLVVTTRALSDVPREIPEVLVLDGPPVTGDRADDLAAPGLPAVALDDVAILVPVLAATGGVDFVPLTHRALAARALGFQAEFPLEPRDRVLRQWPLTSWLLASELLWPLVAGAHVVLTPAALTNQELAAAMIDEGITVAHLAPAQLAALLRDATIRRGMRLRRVFCVGDGATTDLATEFTAQSSAILHFAYGSLEAGGIVAVSDEVGASLVLGRGIADATVEVLDPFGRAVELGNVGEICVRTPGGLVRTGDLARTRPEGVQPARRVFDVCDSHGLRFPLQGVESVLQRDDAVAAAGVVWREDAPGDHRLVTYLEAAAPREMTDDFGLAVGRVAEWQVAFDAYAAETTGDGDHLDRLGAFLRDRAPERVLELGCGQGGLAARVATAAKEYVACDFSAAVLALAAKTAAASGADHVVFEHREADDFLTVPAQHYDAVVANALTEYLPGPDYLTRVLEGAIDATRDGGVVLLGAVRNLVVQHAAAVRDALATADSARTVTALRDDVERALRRERELHVHPGFFSDFAKTHDRVHHVDIEPSIERGDELRYDVVLHVGPGDEPAGPVVWQDWSGIGTLGALGARLERRPEVLAVAGVPHRACAGPAAAARLLTGAIDVETVDLDTLRRLLDDPAAIEPARVVALAAAHRYRAVVSWASARPGGAFDVILRPETAPARLERFPEPAEEDPRTNDPLATAAVALHRRELAAGAVAFARSQLPAAMAPVVAVVVDEIPRGRDGRPHAAALPVPEGARPALPTMFRPPSTPTEELVVSIFAEALGLDTVGVDDDFFALGGFSLLAVQVTTRLQEEFGLDIEVALVFEAPTAATFAAAVDDLLATRAASDVATTRT